MTSTGGNGAPSPHFARLVPVAALKSEKRGCAFPLCHLVSITHVESLATGPQQEHNTQTLE